MLVSSTVSVQAALTGHQSWVALEITSFYLMVLEAGKVQFRVLKDSVWWGSYSCGLMWWQRWGSHVGLFYKDTNPFHAGSILMIWSLPMAPRPNTNTVGIRSQCMTFEEKNIQSIASRHRWRCSKNRKLNFSQFLRLQVHGVGGSVSPETCLLGFYPHPRTVSSHGLHSVYMQPVSLSFFFKKRFLLKYSWFTILC